MRDRERESDRKRVRKVFFIKREGGEGDSKRIRKGDGGRDRGRTEVWVHPDIGVNLVPSCFTRLTEINERIFSPNKMKRV